MKRLRLLLCSLTLGGCAQRPQATEHSPQRLAAIERRQAEPAAFGPSLPFSRDAHSPNPTAVPVDLRRLMAQCGEPDERLGTVALWLANRGSVGGTVNDIDQLTFALRTAGAPYVWAGAT